MKNEEFRLKFDADKLKKLRTKKKLTWLELSRELKKFEPNISKNSVWGWERGRHQPSLKSLNALSSFFGLPINKFMTKSEPATDNLDGTIVPKKALNFEEAENLKRLNGK